MDLEPRGVSEGPPNFLRACLVEGEPEQQRATTIRRRAILLSIILQTIAVAVLGVFPLLGKSEHIPVRIFVERPPYRLGSDHPGADAAPRIPRRANQPCLFCKQPANASKPLSSEASVTDLNPGEAPGVGIGPVGTPDGVPDGLPLDHRAPTPPELEHSAKEKTKRLIVGHIDPAYLTIRIEPVYPHLALQMRREGRVELRAIIATDGSIQSLEVLSGDPLFYQSALEAVRGWRYHPTYLDRRAVEVDTHITVIYSLSR
jgi:TonB family protein